MQSFSSHIPSVGHQHEYINKGLWSAFSTIYRNEGIRGLWRGVDTSMIRTGIGSAVQLSTYDQTKAFLLSTSLFGGRDSVHVHFSASLITSFFVCLAMNPFDVAMTRMVRVYLILGLNSGWLLVQPKSSRFWQRWIVIQKWPRLYTQNSPHRRILCIVQGRSSTLFTNRVSLLLSFRDLIL